MLASRRFPSRTVVTVNTMAKKDGASKRLTAADEDKSDQQSDAAVMDDLAATTQTLRTVFFSPTKSKAPDDADRIITLQSRHVVALGAIAEFLRRSGGGEDIARRFLELADAISGLRKGIVADLVRPAIPFSRPPDGVVDWAYRHEVVIGLECIVRSGRKKTLKEAAKYISKKYPAFERLKRNDKDNLASAILSWRANIRALKAPNSTEAMAHERNFFESLGNISANEMYARGEQCLTSIAKVLVAHEF
jgi:hypothetical protein